MGASTGGPPALQKLFSGFTSRFSVPVVVVQHMPVGHTAALAGQPDRPGTGLRVFLAYRGAFCKNAPMPTATDNTTAAPRETGA